MAGFSLPQIAVIKIKKNFRRPLTSSKDVHFNFNPFGWRELYRHHYIFIKILMAVQTLVLSFL